MEIGKANYNSGSKEYVKRNFFKLKPGDNFYRILPPCFSLAAKGEWAKYYPVHFGYRGVPDVISGRIPYRPFICPRKMDRNKRILVPCAEHDKIEQVLDAYNKKKDELSDDPNLSAEEVHAKLEPLSKFLKEHNVTKRWHLNVKNNEGEMGCLKIPHTAYVDLVDTIRTVVEKYGIDPTAVDGGVMFNIKRTGVKFNEIKYKVEVVMEMVSTPQGRFETIKRMPLSEEDVKRMETECFDLSAMYTALSPEEVDLLVSVEGDPVVVDKVFSKSSKASEDDGDADSEAEEGPVRTSNNFDSMSSDQFKTIFGG